ncbi:MAG: helicase HerA-like domain-containing protein [Pseudomonadota bacterium]
MSNQTAVPQDDDTPASDVSDEADATGQDDAELLDDAEEAPAPVHTPLRDDAVYIGTSQTETLTPKKEYLDLERANRHGLVAGATGTGKTVSLQILAEGFSSFGVPVFCADVKGDLSGLAAAGAEKDFLAKRADKIGFADDYRYEAFPTIFWDLFGDQGHPIRTTVTEMGPLLLSRLLDLNETQEGVLNIAFRLADDENLPILDLRDLRALLVNVGERTKELGLMYGNISVASVGAIQRRLLVLEEQGGMNFFGEPALDIRDFMRTTRDGRGYVNVLAADKLMQSPRLYATFLLWLLSELFEELPEVGDPKKPKLVFFFDEAHLLFNEAPKALLEKVEQVVRLIRSKGVGVYFVTQNPLDVPDTVGSQLGSRVQHALRAFTPREQKAVRAAAETFRPNPDIDTERAIMELGVGEALVSTLERKGAPSVVQRTLIRPPSTRLGPITPDERRAVINESPVAGQYEKKVDRESAHEMLQKRAAEVEARREAEANGTLGGRRDIEYETHGEFRVPKGRRGTGATRKKSTAKRGQTASEAFTKSLLRSLGTAIGGALGRMLGGRSRRRR